ncbi:YggS family pyridoxal phosphate-dependent enzyme [bacterium]|nr:YggS family pyridoxal phosphate-dependent enzyme [bacterium]
MKLSEIEQRIQQNWQSVQQEVNTATLATGCEPGGVRVIGVTKYVDAEWTAALVRAGCLDLGENRPQVLWKKAEHDGLQSGVRWHVIGHLQSNKVRRSLKYQPVIHSIDSERLLHRVATESSRAGHDTEVLLEVNISGDEEKTGMAADLIDQLLSQDLPQGVKVMGLMAMAGFGTDSNAAKRQFDEVRVLRDKLSVKSGRKLSELSMGMSGDYQQAIECGSTMVRIGSRLFDGLLDRTTGVAR